MDIPQSDPYNIEQSSESQFQHFRKSFENNQFLTYLVYNLFMFRNMVLFLRLQLSYEH